MNRLLNRGEGSAESKCLIGYEYFGEIAHVSCIGKLKTMPMHL